MGYESRIYIVRKTEVHAESIGMKWGDTLACFDLGKVYRLSNLLREKPNTGYYVYADNGNDQIIEDQYGKPLTEVSIPEAIQAIEAAIADGEESLGLPPLLAALKAFDEKWYRHLAVLHYGY